MDHFLASHVDAQKFDAIFDTRLSYTTAIQKEVKEWVKVSIDRWKEENPSWFHIEVIPDQFLPQEVFEAEGGAKRRRSSVGLIEFVGGGRVHPVNE